ncbi:MAG: hypothetical protein HY852_00430 [Bradyrhizobium sp.]|uniref:hypothetical protein n=1 Tax=Bradyrhizobium sp. TaxID=376 RepID=UPI0025C6AAAB|nr:hypothetical protein [Bradyrhizobium sp.]MBI5260267.1 hypothetical protein [Bradyrhizobium sp.]
MAVIVGTLANEILAGINFDPTNFVFGEGVIDFFETGGNDAVIGGKSSENHLYGDSFLIEFATGGNDIVVGGDNSLNFAWGDAEQLRLSTGGDDVVIGGHNSENHLCGEGAVMSPSFPAPIYTIGGNDTIIGGDNSQNFACGDAETMIAFSQGGNDTIIGGANSFNDLRGDGLGEGANEFRGCIGGDDLLIGGTNSTNYMYGDAGLLFFGSIGGDDTLIGGVGGINYMYGDGHTINETITGDDRLVSAVRTTDHMWGDAQTVEDKVSLFGKNTFVFSPHNGVDYIYDFHQGQDTIELDGVFNIPLSEQAQAHIPPQAAGHLLASFSDLDIQTVDTNGDQFADSSLIQLGQKNSITVYGVTQLTEADFHFLV